MYVVVCSRWQSELFGSFRRQSELLYVAGNLCCCMFYVAMCVVVCFRWQCVLLDLLGGNLCCRSFRWQCVLLGLLGDNVLSWVC